MECADKTLETYAEKVYDRVYRHDAGNTVNGQLYRIIYSVEIPTSLC